MPIKYKRCKENTTEVIDIRVPLISLVIASATWLGCVDLLAIILLSCERGLQSKSLFAFFCQKILFYIKRQCIGVDTTHYFILCRA